MDRNSLLRLAEVGIGNYPPRALADLVTWCAEWSAASGDARYAVLAAALRRVAAPFDDDEALPSATVRELDVILQEDLPAVVEARSAELGLTLANALKERLDAVQGWT